MARELTIGAAIKGEATVETSSSRLPVGRTAAGVQVAVPVGGGPTRPQSVRPDTVPATRGCFPEKGVEAVGGQWRRPGSLAPFLRPSVVKEAPCRGVIIPRRPGREGRSLTSEPRFPAPSPSFLPAAVVRGAAGARRLIASAYFRAS